MVPISANSPTKPTRGWKYYVILFTMTVMIISFISIQEKQKQLQALDTKGNYETNKKNLQFARTLKTKVKYETNQNDSQFVKALQSNEHHETNQEKKRITITTQASNVTGVSQGEFLVPNIVHYVWFGTREWKFHQMLSVKSVYMNIKPDEIIFHCDNEPIGRWWNYTKEQVPIIKFVKTTLPTEIFGNKITLMEHSSDIKRYQIILEMGGIYLDTDVIALKSFDALRKYEFTLGMELPMHLGNDVIVGARNAKFLKLWYETYKSFSGLEYNVHSVLVPYILSLKYPNLIHVEKYTMNFPDWSPKGLNLLYNKVYDWSKNYCIHMNYRCNRVDYNPDKIRTLNSTFGQIARFIYFGDSSIKFNK